MDINIHATLNGLSFHNLNKEYQEGVGLDGFE